MNKNTYLQITFFLIFSTFYGQNIKLENILKLENKLEPLVFLDTVLNLSFAEKTSNSKLYLKISKKASTIAKDIKDTLKIAKTYEALALAYHFTNKFDAAIENTIKAANCYYSINQINNYGNCYTDLGWRINKKDLDKGIFYMMKGINILEKQPEQTSFLRIGAYNNYGILKQRKFQLDSALYYHNKSFELCLKHNDSIGMPYALVEMGIIYNGLNKKEKAKKILNKALEIRLKIKDNYGIADSYENLGIFYFKNKEYNKSINFFEKALRIAQKSSFNYMIRNITLYLYKCYEKEGKINSAFRYLKWNKQLTDSTNSVKIENRVRELEIQFESAEKEKELLKTRAEKAETELELSKSKIWTFVLFGGLIILAFLSFAIFQTNKRKHQLAIANQKEKSLQSIVLAEEKERARIARELHDGVVQQIGSIILKSRNLFSKKNLIKDDESLALLENLENSNKDLRNISHQMMPRALSELGLIPAIDDLLKGSLHYADIEYTFEHFNVKERLPEKIEITLYRITQELINNIIKHSKAKSVNVQLINSDENILLLIEDDGIGIDKSKSKKGIGFSNIKSRLEMINGEANFDKSSEKGTLVTVRIRK